MEHPPPDPGRRTDYGLPGPDGGLQKHGHRHDQQHRGQEPHHRRDPPGLQLRRTGGGRRGEEVPPGQGNRHGGAPPDLPAGVFEPHRRHHRLPRPDGGGHPRGGPPDAGNRLRPDGIHGPAPQRLRRGGGGAGPGGL